MVGIITSYSQCSLVKTGRLPGDDEFGAIGFNVNFAVISWFSY
jgi:hypothetical protein